MDSSKQSSQLMHVSFTRKAGYLWRKRVDGKMLSVSLKTFNRELGMVRGRALTMRFIQCKGLMLPFEALRETLKQTRDVIIDRAILEGLSTFNVQNQWDNSNSVHLMDSMPVLTFTNGGFVPEGLSSIETPDVTLSNTGVSSAYSGHLLSDVLAEWTKDMTSEWKPRTERLNRKSIELFIGWYGDKDIASVDKSTIAAYKQFLETHFNAPRSRQDALIKLQAMFNFAIDKRDWLVSNAVKGMTYSKVVTMNEKSEISVEAYNEALSTEYVQKYETLKWMLMILWNTGMRISEAIQLRPEDFRIVDGVKCISINDENGKSLKTGSSMRNIPVNSHLNELWSVLSSLPQGKAVLGWNKVNAAGSRLANAFKQIGLNHSSHDFRMSLSNRLRDLEIADSVRYAIMGHSNTVTTDRVYQTRRPLKQMLNALEKI